MDEQSIFLEALEQPSSEAQAAWLDEACGDDQALKQRLMKMLQKHARAENFLEKPAPGLEATISPNASRENLADALDVGLAPAFGEDAAVVLGNANHSVLRSIGNTIDEVPRVSLRESKAEGEDPIARPNSPETPNTPGDNRYQLQGEIARGGMGAIIKGRDTDLGRDLAIKVLLDSHKDKPDVIQRFVEEAQIGGQLQHPGIAPVYELGQFGDQRPYFSMKLVKGETLAKLLANRDDADDDRGKFIGVFEQVCQTMAYAHSRGVIHRDLKPANIMVGAFGEVQVMDWGLAKVLQVGGVADEKKSQMQQGQSVIQTLRSGVGSDAPAVGSVGSAGSETQMGSVMGTPAYMPPEQALGEIDNLDERADVFGLGAMLCEILTGKPPYVAHDGTRVFRLASRGKLDDCFERLDTCGANADLIAIAKHCLELEPADRPRDAGVLSDRITQYLESVETRLRETEKRRAAEAARAIEERKRRRVIVASFCTVAALLVVIAAGSILAASHFRKMEQRATQTSKENFDLAGANRDLADKAEYDLMRSYVAFSSKALERDEPFDALFWSGRAWQADKASDSNEYHRMRIAATLADVPRLAGVCFHVAPVLDVDINRDGTRLVSRTTEQRAFVWDFVAGKLATPPLQHAGAIRHVEFSPDGALILTASEDKTAALWNSDTGSRILVLQHNASVCAASFSKDGRTVVSVAGNQVWRWDALTGQSLGDPSECQDVIWHLSVNRERNLAVTADNSGHARVWDISTGEQVCEPVTQRVPIDDDLEFYRLGPNLSPNGKILVAYDPTATRRGAWKAYNVSNDQEIWSVRAAYFSTPSWSNDSRHVVFNRGDLLEIVDANSGEILPLEFRVSRQSSYAALSRDGRLFAGVSGGGIYTWDTATGKKRGQPLQFADFLRQLRVSTDGKWLVACAQDGTARVWDLSPRNLTKPYSQDCGRAHLAMYHDGSSVSPDGRYRFKPHQTGGVLESSVEEALRSLPHSSRVIASCFSEDGKRLATLAGNEVRVWDVPSGTAIGPAKIIDGEFSVPPRLELTSDGELVAAVFAASPARRRENSKKRPAAILVWHAADQLLLKIPAKISSGTRIHGPSDWTGQVTDVRLSSDGRLAAAAVESTGELFVYSVESDKLHYRMPAFRGWLGGLSFSDDGKVLLVGSSDERVRQFLSETGKPAGPALRHPSWPILIGVEPKGNRVATLSLDLRLRLWDRLTGDLLANIPVGQFSPPGNCWFSSDGATVQYGSSQQLHSLRVPKYEGPSDAVPLAIQLITGKQWDDRGGVVDLWRDEFIKNRHSYRKAWLAWQQLSDAQDAQP